MSEIKSVGGVREMKDWTKNAWNKVAIPFVLAGLNWAGTERINREKRRGYLNLPSQELYTVNKNFLFLYSKC